MMVRRNESTALRSVQVAPLHIIKDQSRSSSRSTYRRSNRSIQEGDRYQHAHFTPPMTPNGSRETLEQPPESPMIFHRYLRAFYQFQPEFPVSESTVTLPLNEGDVVLVHSIHTNGWADGTLLATGSRGWLPTNYCEPYDPESMQNLLVALNNLWDLLRSHVNASDEIFRNQDFMRGLIAGVRFLLEQSNCLNRESTIVQRNEPLRRNRKALLSDLSSLVKTAKYLSDLGVRAPKSEEVNDIIDSMILKAFKVVTRAVRLLDIYEIDVRSQTPNNSLLVAEESIEPLTPPAEVTSFGHSHSNSTSTTSVPDTVSHSDSDAYTASDMSSVQQAEVHYRREPVKRESVNGALVRSPTVINRLSHRVSVSGPKSKRSENLVSEKLNHAHDTFLSYLGSFIGRLHLQSQLSTDLLTNVNHCFYAGQTLLTIIEQICGQDNQNGESAELAKEAMYECVNELMAVAEDAVRPAEYDAEEVMTQQESKSLMFAATDCVKAAGELVAKAKFIIERIGDFEFELEQKSVGLGIDMGRFEKSAAFDETTAAVADSIPEEPTRRSPPAPHTMQTFEKPLPEVPGSPKSGELQNTNQLQIQDESPRTRSFLPPLPKPVSPLMPQNECSPSAQSLGNDVDYPQSVRGDSIAVSSSGTSSTYLSSMRDSEASMVSQTSTRATTPDVGTYHPLEQHADTPELNMSASYSTLGEDTEDEESRMLEKTYAHELIYKDGQITGGSLQALIERLTTHDSTPDAMFVSTFYLTFRLFVGPEVLAEALVDRFEYVEQSPHIAGPVRLRVYNVFKGWLESHWRAVSDNEALPIIESFAQNRLGSVLPAAGNRLIELAQKVSSTETPLVPRLLSSMGKTSLSTAQYIPPDTPLPAPVMPKSSTNVLKNWKMGGSLPTVMEFCPLELARQLTIKEMNIFCSIMPEELLASEWTKRSGSNAVNVRAMSTFSTDLANLVTDTVLQFDDAKRRAITLKHWIKVAMKCLEINNYDTLMAIISSINTSTILRLKKTWELVSQKHKDRLKILQDLVEPTKNHVVLRQRLQNHVPPCLPFVGTYLTDLTFVDIGNPGTRQLSTGNNGQGKSVINFDKHTRTAKIIGELQRFQIPYRLTEVPDFQEWIQAQIVRVKSSDPTMGQQYYRKSLLLEPRDIQQKQSPIDSTLGGNSTPGISSKEKFFAWTHHSKDRQAA